MTLHRGSSDMLRWITRLQLSRSRTQEAWDDTCVHQREHASDQGLRFLPAMPRDDHSSTRQQEIEKATLDDHPDNCELDCLDVRFPGRSGKFLLLKMRVLCRSERCARKPRSEPLRVAAKRLCACYRADHGSLIGGRHCISLLHWWHGAGSRFGARLHVGRKPKL